MWSLVKSSLVLVSFSSFLPSLHSTTYVQTRLEEQCAQRKSKLRLKLKSQVNIITFNSSVFPEDNLHCHIEFSVPSAEYGLSVFIEEMKLGSCDQDFVQFGRDILFVTTHLSKRYCGHLPPPSFNINNGVRTASLPYNTVEHRYYTEQSDNEMDMWVVIKKPRTKFLTLVVTPFKKRCSPSDSQYIQCGQTARCVRRNLFCDGRVNCEWPHGQPADESQCKEVVLEPETDSVTSPGAGLVLGLGLLLLLLSLTAGLLYLYQKKQPARSAKLGSQQVITRPLQGQEDLLLTSGLAQDFLPSSPPPYAPAPPRYEVIWT